ncbi:MAG: DUF736 domain-containing protein [Methylocella sp.]
MVQIGTFTRGEDGVFAGTIKTLSLNVKARLIPTDASANDKAPDLRVLAGTVEIGAAWQRISKENTAYHSVKLDDHSFPAPIYANLFKGETDYTLVWSRHTTDCGVSLRARRRTFSLSRLCVAR